MTMADLEAQQAARRAAGRASRASKCPCGKKLASTPGKVAKSYCSDACRKRAKRASSDGPSVSGVETHNAAGQAALSAPKTALGFSSNAKSPSTPGQSGCEGETTPKRTRAAKGEPKPAPAVGRDARFERRDRHQTVALGKRFVSCGIKLLPGAAAEIRLDGLSAHLAHVQVCSGVNTCPVCMAKILPVRASNIQLMSDGLAAAGYQLGLGTNTLRHFERMPYGSLRKDNRGGLVALLHDGWKGGFGSAGRPWRRLRDDWGIVGYERAYEDTWGADTGFHLHWHVLWVLAKRTTPLTAEEWREFQRAVAATWRDAVVAAGGYEVSMTCDRPGCPCQGEGHGTDVRPLGKDEEGEAARYLYKDGDKKTATIGLELTGAEFKDARRFGRLSPLQLGDVAAAELVALGQPGDLVSRYREREAGVHSVRRHFRTMNLNRLVAELGIPQDVRTEQEIAGEEGEGMRVVAVIPPHIWYRFVAYREGRRLALIRAAESLGEVGVRTLVESWGLVWGRDVLPAPEPVTEETGDEPQLLIPTPEETAVVQAAVAMDRQESAEWLAFAAARRAVQATRQDEIGDAIDRARGVG